jgi:hypothetical protein
MLVKSKQGERNARWRRQVRGDHRAERPTPIPESSRTPRERRDGGPSQDHALYTCECGYAFEALVTTSVGCPNCERTQAW